MTDKIIIIKSDNYCIDKLELVCNDCNSKFIKYNTNYEIVQFRCSDGNVRFLPTYGKYGYLNLMEILMGKEYTEHIPPVINSFIVKLSQICPYDVELYDREFKCPVCGSENTNMFKEDRVFNLPVKWLEINLEKLEQYRYKKYSCK